MAARKGPPKGPKDQKRKGRRSPRLTVVEGGRPPESAEKPPSDRVPPSEKPQPTCPVVYDPKVDIPPVPPSPKRKKGDPPPRKRHGRPFVCNGPVRRKLIQNAYLGLYHKDVAAEAGVSVRAMNRLLKQAQAAEAKAERGRQLTEWDEELCRFWRAFRQAEIGPKKVLLSIVMGVEDPKVALEVMGRRWANEFARRTLVGNAPDTDEAGQPVQSKGFQTATTEADPETLELLRAELANRGQPDRILQDDDEGAELADELPEA